MRSAATHIPGDSAPQGRPSANAILVSAFAVAALTGWTFWPTFVDLIHLWNTDDGYSHGYLVPAFAGFLLWARRDRLPQTWQPRPILGIALVAASMAIRTVAGLRGNVWPEQVSLVPYLAGVALALGGWPFMKWALPAIGYLVFMIRLPYRLEVALGAPLQHLATVCSTFILQTMGLPALAEGNVIHIREVRLEVVQACSGLKMLFTFVAFTSAAFLLVKKPLSDRLMILASAVPIALLVNTIRIVATGLAFVYCTGDTAHKWSHDLAGWLMMPMALALLGVELWILKGLIVEIPMRAAARR